MRVYEAAFCEEAERRAGRHLLQHFRKGVLQEDLCFALWRPASGKSRYSGLIYKIILPEKEDRILQGNVKFAPRFLSRSVRLAVKEKAGLAFMHSHPADGWQDMSEPDIIAERDVLASPAMTAGRPLLGLTVGTDGFWSARFWEKEGKQGTIFQRRWCQKVRVAGGKSYKIYCNDHLLPPPKRKEALRRTFDTWGVKHQNNIARLKVGIVGLGSVGCIVAEALARIGVERVVLIDPDKVEAHNLDRLLFGRPECIGDYKVNTAKRMIEKSSTAGRARVRAIPLSVHCSEAYNEALDCDLLFSCVDRPMARDVLNFISFAHLIPVIDGGVQVTLDKKGDFYNAHWRSHIVTPYHQCMRCNRQYTTSDVSLELDGSLDDPSYIGNLPSDQRGGNQNVFPFSLAVASDEINAVIRYIISKDWHPEVQQRDFQFLTGLARINNQKCNPNCVFQKERIAVGDRCKPHYIVSKTAASQETKKKSRKLFGLLQSAKKSLQSAFRPLFLRLRKYRRVLITKFFGKESWKE